MGRPIGFCCGGEGGLEGVVVMGELCPGGDNCGVVFGGGRLRVIGVGGVSCGVLFGGEHLWGVCLGGLHGEGGELWLGGGMGDCGDGRALGGTLVGFCSGGVCRDGGPMGSSWGGTPVGCVFEGALCKGGYLWGSVRVWDMSMGGALCHGVYLRGSVRVRVCLEGNRGAVVMGLSQGCFFGVVDFGGRWTAVGLFWGGEVVFGVRLGGCADKRVLCLWGGGGGSDRHSWVWFGRSEQTPVGPCYGSGFTLGGVMTPVGLCLGVVWGEGCGIE